MIHVAGHHEMQAEFFSRNWATKPAILSRPTRHLLSAFPNTLQGQILEVGAGTGAIARFNTHLDIISADLVYEGIGDLGTRAAVCPLDRLPFKTGAFDVVLAFEVLEHVSEDSVDSSLAEIARVLRPKGHLLISVPTWPLSVVEWILKAVSFRRLPTLATVPEWDHPHERRYMRGMLEATLARHRLTTIGVHRWCRSAFGFGEYLLNPLLSRAGLPAVDLAPLDALLPFDSTSNQLLLAEKAP